MGIEYWPLYYRDVTSPYLLVQQRHRIHMESVKKSLECIRKKDHSLK